MRIGLKRLGIILGILIVVLINSSATLYALGLESIGLALLYCLGFVVWISLMLFLTIGCIGLLSAYLVTGDDFDLLNFFILLIFLTACFWLGYWVLIR